MIDTAPVAPVEGVEQMPDSTAKLQAAVNEYKKVVNTAQQEAAVSGIVDIYMELIGENPTSDSIDAAGSLIGQFVVEKTGDYAERPEDSNSWPNFHTKMMLYSRVLESALLRSKSPKPESAVAPDAANDVVDGVQKRLDTLAGKNAGGGHIGDLDAMDSRM